MSDTKITASVDSNEIKVPMEWTMGLGFLSHYVQITLVDDRIVIHNPLDADAKYTAPCKVSDDSYIRAFGLLGVKIPKQLLDRLNITIGDKIDMELEENCILFRKNTGTELPPSEAEPKEPPMAFCCVCGNLLYTDGLLKGFIETLGMKLLYFFVDYIIIKSD